MSITLLKMNTAARHRRTGENHAKNITAIKVNTCATDKIASARDITLLRLSTSSHINLPERSTS
jgi:hypothetical protein